MGDRNRHAAEDERMKRQHRVPVEAPEQTSRSEVRHLVQSHLAWRVAAFDPPRQPRFAGQLHLGFENELMTRLGIDHAPEVERFARPEVDWMASAAS
jgi:predicted metal-dependent hydrolase